MGFLVTAIMCSSSVGLTFAYAKAKNIDTLNVTFSNYLMAFGLSTFMLLRQIVASDSFGVTLTEQRYLTFFAIYTGVLYLMGFLGIQFSVLKNGPSITTMFNRLGMVVPVAASIFIFSEVPTPFRWAGIILAIFSLIAYSYDGGFQFNGLLFTVFALGGAAELSNKLFSVLFDESLKSFYLFVIFSTCSIITASILKFRTDKHAFTQKEIQVGIFLGAANFSTAFFILKSLVTLPSTIVYPALSVGAILVTAIMSKLFFGEIFDRKTYIVLGLTVVSLIFINL